MQQSGNRPTIENLSNSEALDLIAQIIDDATDKSDLDLITVSLELADELTGRGIQPTDEALLDYYRANAWACRYQVRCKDRVAAWDFEQEEARQQIFLLRRALNCNEFDVMDALRRCQILTNLAILLNDLGRFVEALRYWNTALKINPNFWMALGNRGRALKFYATSLHDLDQAEVFLQSAHRDLVNAVGFSVEYPHLGDHRHSYHFSTLADQIARHCNIDTINKSQKKNEWELGENETERQYRSWCLDNVLFVNPLNDVTCTSIAARDIMTLPDFITNANEPTIVVGMFNELKQGFVSARWLLWEGIHSNEQHLSDRDVLLYNTLDYPSYGLSIEKLKMSFRITYSLLDKIGYFLNHYLKLGIPEKRVSFKRIWRENDNRPVRDRFAKSENWPFRGLFWLSKDLFEEDMRDSTEPEARALAELRNHIEHKYLKVHEILLPKKAGDELFHDHLAHSITRDDLEQRTLRLMQLVRAALIYLSLGMHREEKERAKEKQGLAATMQLEPFDDGWKR